MILLLLLFKKRKKNAKFHLSYLPPLAVLSKPFSTAGDLLKAIIHPFWLRISPSPSLGGKGASILFSLFLHVVDSLHAWAFMLVDVIWVLIRPFWGYLYGLIALDCLHLVFPNFPNLHVRDLAKFLAFLFADCNLWLWGAIWRCLDCFWPPIWCLSLGVSGFCLIAHSWWFSPLSILCLI